MPKGSAKQAVAEVMETEKPDPILYDAGAEQRIPLTLHRNGRDMTVHHNIAPLEDVQYFRLQEDLEQMASRFKVLSTAVYGPKETLWHELAQSVEGYKPRDDWREGVHRTHKSEAITALISVQLTESDEADSASEFWDIDETVKVPFSSMYGGALLATMSHTFKPESKADMDEFLLIGSDEPNPKEIASAKKRCKAERLATLGRKLLAEHEGYANGSRVPAWHLAATTEAFFLRQASQVGKFLA